MKADKIRVLQVIGAMNCGGAETLLINLHRSIDRSRIQFDYVVHTNEKAFYDKEIKELGGRIYHCPKFNGINIIEYIKWWNGFFKKHPEYKIVHGHIGSSAAIYLTISRLHGAYTIAHSHSTASSKRSISTFLWKTVSYPTRFVANYYMACSYEAGYARFGERVVTSKSFKVLKNAIDCNRFRFNSEIREKMRKELHIEDNYVVGHVGRFVDAKNHSFLIDIFLELKRKNPSAKLLLLGEGPLVDTIREKCKTWNLEKDVLFMGVQKNIEDFYMSMDVFCLPSKYEGLPLATVEAQVSGLKVIVSDVVPTIADIHAGLFNRLNLSLPPRQWAKKLLDSKSEPREKDTINEAITAGFDIKVEARKIEEFYIEACKKVCYSRGFEQEA